MEAVSCKVLNMEGKEIGSIDLDPEVFDAKINEALVHQAVRWQRNCKRAGTHSALRKAEVSGGGKKPFRQKGTGRARAGSNTSPLWVGGGVIHGPKPKSYEFRFNKRERRVAMASVLTDLRRSGNLLVLDDLNVESGKTRDMQAVLTKIGVGRSKAAIVTAASDRQADTVSRCSRNISNVVTLPVAGVNVYDLINARFLVTTRASVTQLQSRVKGGQEK